MVSPVKVLEVCAIAPFLDTATTQTSLPFTFFDTIWVRFPPTQRIFFYQTPSFATGTDPRTFLETVLVPKLKHSLSVALQHYLPLAGKVKWPSESDRPIIHYQEGDGVSFILADSEADFDLLSGHGFVLEDEFHPLLPDLEGSETEVPAIALQVTLFGDKGFSVGYAAHHAVVDGKSASMFMHSWASLCRSDENEQFSVKPELAPCYDRTLVKDPADLAKIYLSFWLERIGPNNKSLKMWELKPASNLMRGTFLLTRDQINRIKDSVRAHWQEKNHQEKVKLHVSTFTITVAYVWSCLVKAKKPIAEKVNLSFIIDCRARLDPPLPSTYFGNCVLSHVVSMDLSELVGEDGVANAAEAIGAEIEGLNNNGGVLKDGENYLPRLLSYASAEGGLESIAGSPRFGLYDADFGWGKPKKIETISIDKTGAFSLTESGDGNGGIEIGIVLMEPQLNVFASFFSAGKGLH